MKVLEERRQALSQALDRLMAAGVPALKIIDTWNNDIIVMAHEG